MRREYRLTPEQHAAIMEASKPTPYMVIGGHVPNSVQENANLAWERLGRELGFRYMTVRPSPKGQMFFTAEPTEKDVDISVDT